MNQFWEIELEFMSVTRGIGTLDLTEFALKAGIHDLLDVFSPKTGNSSVMLFVNQSEEIRKGIAVFKTHPATVAYLEGPVDFLPEERSVPVFGFFRIVSGSFVRKVRNP